MQIIEIKNFDKNLVDEVFKIHNEVFLFNDRMSFQAFENEFKQDNRYYFVAKNKSGIVGYVGAINCLDSFEIIGIGVKKNYQNKGIGGELLKSLIDKAKETNVDKIFLEVDEKNLSAQNFYKKNNFIITNVRKKYYKDSDALILMRSIL